MVSDMQGLQLWQNLVPHIKVNIFIDYKYAFLILHAHAAIWKERGMLTTKGSSIRHSYDILALLIAVLLPKEVLVINCRGHQKGKIR
jgi:hypothetical protein